MNVADAMPGENHMPESIIWPPARESGTDTVQSTRRDIDPSGAWWQNFVQRIGTGDDRRLRQLEINSIDIVSHLPDPNEWGQAPSPYNGLVVGAVQSGKTESMIGVSAMAIDAGYKIVIVLTGDNEDLRRQTALRFNTQLLGQSDRKIGPNAAWTIPGAIGPGPLDAYAPHYSVDATDNTALATLVSKYLRRGSPIVVTVKKDKFNLEALGGALRSANLAVQETPVPVLVIDDECDEGSVGAAGPANSVPTAINDLWRSSLDDLRVAYLGYTATAAANLLQDTDNPLYPRNLIYLLRYPAGVDGILSWQQPKFNGWYTGGDIYYRQFGYEAGLDANFLVRSDVTEAESKSPRDNETLMEALIAYFVSGAYRLFLQPDSDFEDANRLPEPHCMLVQASQSKRDHSAWRNEIRDLLGGEDQSDKTVAFDTESLAVLLAEDEERWRKWFTDFDVARSRIRTDYDFAGQGGQAVTWDDIKSKLPEVFLRTRLKVINSDEAIGTNLDFEQGWSEEGPVARQDSYVIIVGGQKLSRGITVEGLCITYYSRESHTRKPYADATLQLSRWFGYRGAHLAFCRLFTTEKSYSTLLDINENDQDYRRRLAGIGANLGTQEELRIALRETPSFRATAKVGAHARRHNLKFSPFTHLFTQVEIGAFGAENERWASTLVSNVKNRGCRTIYSTDRRELGLLSRNWTASEIADLLDGIQLSGHNPEKERFPNPELYRDTDTDRPRERLLELQNDPYVVAAYLRYWSQSERSEAPNFNLIVPFGRHGEPSDPFDFPLLSRAITSNPNLVRDTWIADGYVEGGIQFLDGPSPEQIDAGGHRISDSPGLLALYVMHKNAQGRGSGIVRDNHTVTFGIAIPAGGPAFQVVTNYEVDG